MEETKLPKETLDIIDETARQTAIAVENRIVKTLSSDIKGIVKPLDISKVDYLEEQIKEFSDVFNELCNSFFGLWMYNRVIKRLNKKAEKERLNKIKESVVDKTKKR